MAQRIRQRKQPVQQRSQRTTEVILEATLQVLLRDGYASFTTTRVAERAGVSVGTLYQYFPDKRSLVTALKVRYFGLMLDAVRAAAVDPKLDTLEEALRSALGALLRVKQENRALTLALRTPMTELNEGNFVRETLEQFVALLAPVVARTLPALTDMRRVILVVAALEGAISHAVYEAPDWLHEEWFLSDLVALATRFLAPQLEAR